jgi:hypothetical protein
LNTRGAMLLTILVLLLAAGSLSLLFSLFLPTSASLLAPTRTLTPTVTATPTATLTATSTSTPLPAKLITPSVIPFPPLTIYWTRTLWEEAVGKNYPIEDFEKDPADYGELGFPYFTGNHFILSGKSAAQFLNAPELLPSGNLLHFRDWEYGLTFMLPNDATTTALGFDYASQEEWQLTVRNIDIILPSGRNQFVGIVLYEGPTKEFRLMGPNTAQGGLSVDNISYIP